MSAQLVPSLIGMVIRMVILYGYGVFTPLMSLHSYVMFGVHCPLSTVIVQLPCIFSLSVGQLIQGLPAMRLDLDHECARSLLYSFA